MIRLNSQSAVYIILDIKYFASERLIVLKTKTKPCRCTYSGCRGLLKLIKLGKSSLLIAFSLEISSWFYFSNCELSGSIAYISDILSPYFVENYFFF